MVSKDTIIFVILVLLVIAIATSTYYIKRASKFHKVAHTLMKITTIQLDQQVSPTFSPKQTSKQCSRKNQIVLQTKVKSSGM